MTDTTPQKQIGLVEFVAANQERIKALIEAGVFELYSGQIEININDGIVKTVHIHRLTYTHKRPSAPPSKALPL